MLDRIIKTLGDGFSALVELNVVGSVGVVSWGRIGRCSRDTEKCGEERKGEFHGRGLVFWTCVVKDEKSCVDEDGIEPDLVPLYTLSLLTLVP